MTIDPKVKNDILSMSDEELKDKIASTSPNQEHYKFLIHTWENRKFEKLTGIKWPTIVLLIFTFLTLVVASITAWPVLSKWLKALGWIP